MKNLPYAVVSQAVVIPVLAVAIAMSFLYLPGQPVALQYAVVIVLAYLLGSLSWGYLLLRWRLGMDVREYGSGRTGMANVLRTGGGKVAAVVFALDVGKGVLAVMMAKEATGASGAEVAAALAAQAGHNWPVFLGFRGGRGILTAFGGFFIMTPVPAVVATVTFLVTALGSRYISLGSIIGVMAGAGSLIGLVALAGWYSQTYMIFAGVATTMLIWQHRDNIQRLIQGNERRIGAPATPVE